MSIAIVYDRSNIDSVISATMIKKLYKDSIYVSLFIDSIYDNYVFVGVKPSFLFKQKLMRNNKPFIIIDDFVFNDDTTLPKELTTLTLIETILKLDSNQLLKEQSSFINESDIETFKQIVLNTEYKKLSLLTYMFYNDTKFRNIPDKNKPREIFSSELVSNQALVWYNYLEALNDIDSISIFTPEFPRDLNSLNEKYTAFLDKVKQNINRVSYLEVFETYKGKKIKIFCCNIRQDVQPFVLKLATNVYKNVLLFEHVGNNIVVMLHSPVDSLEVSIKRFFTAEAIFNNDAHLLNNTL